MGVELFWIGVKPAEWKINMINKHLQVFLLNLDMKSCKDGQGRPPNSQQDSKD